MKKTISGGGVVVGPNKKILVVNQHGLAWSLPKGHVDPGEDEKAAAIREIKEESGITDVKAIRELGTYQRHKIGLDPSVDDMTELKTIKIYLFTTDQSELRPEDPDNPEARWVDPAEVEALLTHPKDKAFFAKILPEFKSYL